MNDISSLLMIVKKIVIVIVKDVSIDVNLAPTGSNRSVIFSTSVFFVFDCTDTFAKIMDFKSI